MDPRKLLLLIPLVLIVSTSGCTVPGLGSICLPFFPCDRVVEFEDDVVVIKSLEALPQTVTNGQQIRLVTYIQNVGKEPVPQDDIEELDSQRITVDLYDFCKGLFSSAEVTGCDGSEATKDCVNGNDCKCVIEKLLPGQIKEVSWTLKAGSDEQVPLKTECDFKVAVTYPYRTKSLTQITFIDYQEMQRQLSEGTFRNRDTYIVSGYGPVKPRITVEDQQPIPVQDEGEGKTIVALRIKNSGSGYLCRLDKENQENDVVCDSKMPKENIKIEGIGGASKLDYVQGGTCTFPNGELDEDATLIKKETPPYLCEVMLKSDTNLPKETTEHVTTDIEYLYEFRKEIKIVIEPKT